MKCSEATTKTFHVQNQDDGNTWVHVINIDEEILTYSKTIKNRSTGYTTESATSKSSKSVRNTDTAGEVDLLTDSSKRNDTSDTINANRSDNTLDSGSNFKTGYTNNNPSVPINDQNENDQSVSNLINDLTSNIVSGKNVQALLRNSVAVFYTDTGGQPEFQEILPSLVGGPTFFF